jgi:hypothetical protein
MPKKRITFWKNEGNEALRGKTVDLFKISWNENSGEWVRDEEGPYWGMYKLDTEEVRRLNRPPEELGEVQDWSGPLYYDEDLNRVNHLEANDLTVTPEAGNLGEEE